MGAKTIVGTKNNSYTLCCRQKNPTFVHFLRPGLLDKYQSFSDF